MGLFGLLGGGAMMAFAGKFGKEMIKDFVVKGSGVAGSRMIDDVFKKSGWGANFIPFTGPFNALRKQVASGFSTWKAVGGYHAAWRADEMRMAGAWKDIWKEKFANNITDMGMRQAAVKTHVNFVKSLKTNPRQFAEDLQGSWSRAMAGYGINGGDPLYGKVVSSMDKYRMLSEQVQGSANLFGTALVSNMAVVGIPTLSSSLATIAIGRSIYGRTKRRLRGYDSIY